MNPSAHIQTTLPFMTPTNTVTYLNSNVLHELKFNVISRKFVVYEVKLTLNHTTFKQLHVAYRNSVCTICIFLH